MPSLCEYIAIHRQVYYEKYAGQCFWAPKSRNFVIFLVILLVCLSVSCLLIWQSHPLVQTDKGWCLTFTGWQRTITYWFSRTGMMIDLHGPTWDDTGSPRTGHGWQRMIPDRHGPTKDDAWSSRTGVHHRSCAYCSLCLLCVVCCVLCVQRHCTFYTRPQHYSLNDDHTRYTTWRALFSMVLFVAEKRPQNAPSTREVSVFLTDLPPKISENLWIEKFPYLHGERFF